MVDSGEDDMWYVIVAPGLSCSVLIQYGIRCGMVSTVITINTVRTVLGMAYYGSRNRMGFGCGGASVHHLHQ